MEKTILSLKKGDKVTYTGLDGIERTLTFVRCPGHVRCIKGQDYTLDLEFEWEGRPYHAPLAAWEFLGFNYEITTMP